MTADDLFGGGWENDGSGPGPGDGEGVEFVDEEFGRVGKQRIGGDDLARREINSELGVRADSCIAILSGMRGGCHAGG